HRIRADDGQAVHVREMIRALRAAGHTVAECALVPKTASVDAPVAAVQGAAVAAPSNGSVNGTANGVVRGAASSRRPGSIWNHVSLPRPAIECLEVLYSRRGAAMIAAAAARQQPDFVYERHALHCRAGLLAKRRLGVPLLLEVNSPMCDEMEKLGLLRFARRARKTEREVLAGADRVLAVSDVLAERLIELGAARDRVRVIRNGAEPSRFSAEAVAEGRRLRGELGLGDQVLVIGFIGFMRPWHRLDMVVEALAALSRQDVHFVVLGEGPALPELLELARARGVADRVHALGAVPGEAVASVCTAFDVALVPAINGYASPLKLFDSLAAGVATLAVDQPNIRELIDDGRTGVLFAPGDTAAFTSKLAELAADPARTRALGAAGRAALSEHDWTWRGSARRVIECFEELRR
ncbi:MAG: glycosyltransferase, partial [Planctomycetes bacterium]|nr:glycosyltransferase [Planctomycetota bacterium]